LLSSSSLFVAVGGGDIFVVHVGALCI